MSAIARPLVEPPHEPDSRLGRILTRLQLTIPFGFEMGLERVRKLCAKLGNPQDQLPPVIHIAGTNGKGSTSTFTRTVLETAGKRVHTFTSPHLVRFNERIRLGALGSGVLADDDTIADALEEAERANGDEPVTYFELGTVAAFLLFSRSPADYTVLEVGLGGRLDATNVIPPPLVAAITPISLDHETFLGETLTAIAGEKAGIIKRGSKVVAAPQVDEVLGVLERAAARAGTALQLGGRDWTAGAENGRLVFQDENGLMDLVPPRLLGHHQYTNAGTAIAALRAAGIAPHPEAISRGLAATEWPARMQRLGHGPLTGHAPAGAELWLDGGHNPGAGEVIAHVVGDLEERVPRPLVLIAGMLTTKDPIGFFRPFAGLARQVIAVPVPDHPKGRPPAELAEAARAAGLAAEPMASVEAALASLNGGRFEAPPRVLICGSLYLAGHVLGLNRQFPS